MLSWIIGNTLVAACAAVGVAIVARFNPSRPAVNHTLWLACFALLVMPPLPMAGQVGAGLRSLTQPSAEPVATKIVTPVWGDGSYNDQGSESDSWALASGKGSLVTTGAAAASNGLTPLELELYLADLAEVEHAAAETTLLGRLGALAPDWTWGTWLLALWGLGSLACFAWAQSRVHGFHRMVKRSPAGPVELDTAVADVAGRLDVRAPSTRVLQGVGSPAVWCLGRPQLLWPAAQVGGVASDLGTRSLIAHELAHIARKDHWVARFDVLAVAALWWNPLFWLIRRELHSHAEMACDALALSTYPGDRRRFAEALIEAHGRTTSAPLAMQGLCATTPDSKDFERRLTMIMKNKVTPGVSKGVAALALAGSVLLAPGIGSTTDEVVPGYVNLTLPSADDGDLEGFITELHDEGEQLFQMGEYASSIAVFEELAEVAPDHGMAQARLGFMKIGMGMHAEAKGHFEREVELGHGVATATYNLACCDALMGDVKGGLGHLAKSMRKGFDQADLLETDGDLDNLRGTRGFDAIVKLTKTAAELRAKFDRGGKTEEVLEGYAMLARICSEDGDVIRTYAMMVHNEGDYAGSEKLFRRQAELGESPEVAYYNVGCAQARQGRTDDAFDSLFTSAKKGFHYPAVVDDPDLVGLQGDKRFVKLTHALTKQTEGYLKATDLTLPQAGSAIDSLRLPAGIEWEYENLEEAESQLHRYEVEVEEYQDLVAFLTKDQDHKEQLNALREHLSKQEAGVAEISLILEQLEADQRAQVLVGAHVKNADHLERALLVLDGQEVRDYALNQGEAYEEAQKRYLIELENGVQVDRLRILEGEDRQPQRVRLQTTEGRILLHEDEAEYEAQVRNLFGNVEEHATIELTVPTEGEWAEILVDGRFGLTQECDELVLGLDALRVDELHELSALGYLVSEDEDSAHGYIVGEDGVHERYEFKEGLPGRYTLDVQGAEEECCDEVEVQLEALGYMGEGHEAEVMRILTERIATDASEVAEVRVRFVTEAADQARIHAEAARVEGEHAHRAAERAHLEAADARETARVHHRDAEAQRAASIDVRRVAEYARRDAEVQREEADRVRVEAETYRRQAERVRLDSIELEKAAKQQEALRRDLERRDEIEALRREIDRLERELDKAKAKKGHGHAQGASSAAAPVSSFTSSIFNAF